MTITPQNLERLAQLFAKHPFPVRPVQRAVAASGVMTLYDKNGDIIASMTVGDYEALLAHKETPCSYPSLS